MKALNTCKPLVTGQILQQVHALMQFEVITCINYNEHALQQCHMETKCNQYTVSAD